ncbi:MAG: serine protease [Deltaproteobacteria bacterium]|nr:serine protease [Deltaproteobacteria bacterium]
MKYRISILSCVFLYLVAVNSTFAQGVESAPPLFKQLSSSVVIVYTYDKAGKKLSRGSGFFINDRGDILTARSVIKGAYSVLIKTTQNKSYVADKLLAVDQAGGIVRFSTGTPPQDVQPLLMSEKATSTGERIVIIGSPDGDVFSIKKNVVMASNTITGMGTVLQFDAPFPPGMIGSPVLNIRGEVVGVATMQYFDARTRNFATPCQRVVLADSPATYESEPFMAPIDPSGLSPDDSFQKGMYHLYAGEKEKAVTYLKKASRSRTPSADAFFYLGLCLGDLDCHRSAAEAFRETLRLKPKYADAHRLLGMSCGKLGLRRDEIEAYREAIRIKPDDACAHFFLGLACLQINDKEAAIAEYAFLKELGSHRADELNRHISEYKSLPAPPQP